jgi:hypothetical protein
LVSCEDLKVDEYTTGIINELSAIEVNNKYFFDFNFETDAVFVDGEVVWRVAFATDEFLNEYDSYVLFIEEDGVPIELREYKYAFLPYTTLRDFQWIEIGQAMTEGVLGIQYYERNVLHSAGDLPPGMPFVISPMFSDMPRRGVSYLDANGERRKFAIILNEAEPEDRLGTFIIINF